MLTIPKEKVDARWDNLPIILREALFDTKNADLVRQVGEINKLSEQQIEKLFVIAGDVLYGFLKRSDLIKEIKDSLGVEEGAANGMALEIGKKIFDPIQIEIDKVISELGTAEAPIEKQPLASPTTIPGFLEIKAEPAPFISAKINEQSLAPAAKLENIVSETMPKAPEPVAAPFVIHEEQVAKPVIENKKTLGGVFGFLNKKPVKETNFEETKAVMAQVDLGSGEATAFGKREPVLASTKKEEQLRQIRYESAKVESPFNFGGNIPMPPEQKNIIPPMPTQEEKPLVKEEVKQVDFIQTSKKEEPIKMEEIKKEISIPIPPKSNELKSEIKPEIKSDVLADKSQIISDVKPTTATPIINTPVVDEFIKKEEVKQVDFLSEEPKAEIINKKSEDIKPTEPTTPINQTTAATPADDIIDLRSFKIGK